MKRITLALAAAALGLAAACSSSGSSPPAAPAPVAAAPSPGAASAPGYDNADACAAFQAAVTTGIPDGRQDYAGEDTQTWLQNHEGSVSPELQNLIAAWASAWGDLTDTGAIDRAQAAVTAYCRANP